MARGVEQLIIELCRMVERMRAGNGGEILVTKLELHGSRVQAMLAQTATHHFREPGERGFEGARFGGVLRIGMLVADRFWIFSLAERGVEPSTRIEAERFAGQRQSPFTKFAL